MKELSCLLGDWGPGCQLARDNEFGSGWLGKVGGGGGEGEEHV